MLLLRSLSLAFILLALAACSAQDAGLRRLCEAVLPAVEPRGGLVVEAVGAYPGAERTVVLDYRVTDATGASVGPDRMLRCAFGENGALSSLVTFEGPANATRLYLLNRFWLGDDEAMVAGLRRVTFGEGVWRGIDARIAYPLQLATAALPQAAIYALAAMSFALVLSLTGQIHLAIGQMVMTGAYGALHAALVGAALVPAVPSVGMMVGAFLGGGLAAAGVGWLVGALFLRFAAVSGIAFMVASVGLALVLDETLRLFAGNAGRWIPPILNAPLVLLPGDFPLTVTPVQLAIAGVGGLVAVALLLVLPQLALGRRLEAGSENPQMAELLGVDMTRLRLLAFALSGGLAGLAGAAYTLAYAGPDPGSAVVLGLKALFAAVLVGGSLPGAAAGGLLIGLMENLWAGYLDSTRRDVAVLAVLVLALVLRARDPLRR